MRALVVTTITSCALDLRRRGEPQAALLDRTCGKTMMPGRALDSDVSLYGLTEIAGLRIDLEVCVDSIIPEGVLIEHEILELVAALLLGLD